MYFTKAFLQTSDFKRDPRSWGCGMWDWEVEHTDGFDKMLSMEKNAAQWNSRQKTVPKGRPLEGCERVLCYWLAEKCELNLYKTVPHNMTELKRMDCITCWIYSWVELSNIASGSINSNDYLENWSLVSYKVQSHTCPITQQVHFLAITKRKPCVHRKICTEC